MDPSVVNAVTHRPQSTSPPSVAEAFGIDSPEGSDTRHALLKALNARESSAQESLLKTLIIIALIGASADGISSVLTRPQGASLLTPMAQSNLIAFTLIALSAFIFRVYGLFAGKVAFYTAVLISFAGHAFWVGYGLSTPGLSFLALLIIQEAQGPRDRNLLRPLSFASIALIAAIAVAQATHLFQTVVVPLQQQLVVTAAVFVSVFLLGKSALASRISVQDEGIDASVSQSAMNQNLTTALKARTSFFSSISHEMRTPLHGIKSALTLVQHPRVPEESRQKYFQSIDRSIKDLSRIVDDVLDLSRLESGGFKLEKAPADVRDICRDLIAFFMPTAMGQGLKLELQFAAQRNSRVLIDEGRLRQMLSNLLDNALKFTAGGSIVLKVDVASETARHALWRFSVSDTGCGVAPNEIDELFNPFTQATNQQDSQRAGTGLGLAIVAGLARQMGGDASVSSTLGQGSTFWFTLLLENQTATEPSEMIKPLH